MPALLAPLWRWLDGGSLHPKAKLATLEPRASPTRSMRVIGAGPGRTGTASLKQALEQLTLFPGDVVEAPVKSRLTLVEHLEFAKVVGTQRGLPCDREES